MEHALVLSFISCSVGGTRANLFIRGLWGEQWAFPCPVSQEGGWLRLVIILVCTGHLFCSLQLLPLLQEDPECCPHSELSWTETLYVTMYLESSSADFITTITKDHLTVNAGSLLLWINVINLSSIDVFSLCISSSLINKWRVKSLFCMLWYIPALLVLDKHSDTSLYAEIYDGATVWERRGKRGFCWDVQIKKQGLTEKWE